MFLCHNNWNILERSFRFNDWTPRNLTSPRPADSCVSSRVCESQQRPPTSQNISDWDVASVWNPASICVLPETLFWCFGESRNPYWIPAQIQAQLLAVIINVLTFSSWEKPQNSSRMAPMRLHDWKWAGSRTLVKCSVCTCTEKGFCNRSEFRGHFTSVQKTTGWLSDDTGNIDAKHTMRTFPCCHNCFTGGYSMRSEYKKQGVSFCQHYLCCSTEGNISCMGGIACYKKIALHISFINK